MFSTVLSAKRPASIRFVQRYWNQIGGYQRFLYYIGAILILSGVFHIGVFLTQGGSLSGPVSWRKPITFGFSIGLAALSISWLATYLPKQQRKGWWLLGVLGITGTLEVILIAMQQWRGVASHFNFFNNPFDTTIAIIIPVLIIPVTICIFLITVWAYQALSAPASLGWAIRTGMTLMVIGTIFGMLMIFNARQQFVTETGRPPNVWRDAGAMKVPHALSLHGLQILIVPAWLMQFTPWSERKRLTVVQAIGWAYIGLIAVSAFQMLRGLAPFNLAPLPVTIISLCLLVLTTGYFAVGASLLREQAMKGALRF